MNTTPGAAADRPATAIDPVFTCVQRVPGVRVRQERDDGYLLYQPATDELHLVDARGKAVFDLCDGRSIDDVVAEGACLLSGDNGPEDAQHGMECDVFAFLHKLQARRLVVWT